MVWRKVERDLPKGRDLSKGKAGATGILYIQDKLFSNVDKRWILVLGLCLLSTFCPSQQAIMPLAEVRAGMIGTGRTVFSGSQIEEFQAEILGIIEHSAPGQSIILAKLTGGPLSSTGVIQGMSGSPVYVDGRLIGAVALGFPMAKEAICGIRPIEEMLTVEANAEEPRQGAATGQPMHLAKRVLPGDRQVDHVFSQPLRYRAGGQYLEPIRTPLLLSGFSTGTLDFFSPVAERLGFSLAQGFSGGAGAAGPDLPVEPGSMISVQLMRGDMNVAADGTVTTVADGRVHAFGHRFLAVGTTELPFARSEVITVLPNLQTSFKITRAGNPAGVVRQDRNVAIAGMLGEQASMAGLKVRLAREDRAGNRTVEREYNMEMARDPFLGPLLLQLATFSALDATERSAGPATVRVNAVMQFENGIPPLRLRNLYSGEGLVAAMAALSIAVPAGYALQSGFQQLVLRDVEIDLTLEERRRELRLEQLWSSTKEARPGEEVEIHAMLLDENGNEQRHSFPYRIPHGAPTGPVFFSAADASTLNLLDFPRFSSLTPRSPQQLLELINSLRTNHQLYLRVWRQEPTYSIQGADMPAPPPSAALILDQSTDVKGGRTAVQNAALAEFSADLGNHAVSGAKTIRIEVKAN
jgi:hypothetical protein